MKDSAIYLERMNAAMKEKLFFLEHIDITDYDAVIDIGCADGALLRCLREICGNHPIRMLGYEINEEFVAKSRSSDRPFYHSGIYVTNNFEHLWLLRRKKTLVIFSSVLHEMPFAEASAIFERLYANVSCIVVRDMYFDRRLDRTFNDSKREKIEQHINKFNFTEDELKLYYNHWGKIYTLCNFYHLCLKNEYRENWTTEVAENYFSTPWDYILERAAKNGWLVDYDLPYTLKYRMEQVYNTSGIHLLLPTHRNLILKRSK